MKEKRLLIILCTSLIICALTACGSEEKNNKVVNNEENKITVEALTEKTTDSIETSSEVTTVVDDETQSDIEEITVKEEPGLKVYRRSFKNGDKYEAYYNKDGNIEKEVEVTMIDEGESMEYDETVYTYDGKLLVKKEKCHDGDRWEIIEYRYDNKGNLIEEKYGGRRNQGETEYYGGVEYTYDSAGKPIERMEYRGDSHAIIKYSYNEKNQLIQTIIGNKDITESEYDVYEIYNYDENGYLIGIKEPFSETFYTEDIFMNDSNGNVIEERSYECELDDTNSWKKKPSSSYKKYEYDEQNRMIKEITVEEYSGSVQEIIEYDEFGHTVIEIIYDESGKEEYHSNCINEYEYYSEDN